MPDGFGDGGTDGSCAEYSNVVWNLAGLRAAIAGAKLLGKERTSRRVAEGIRGHERLFPQGDRPRPRRDKHGNLYLPNLMGSDGQRSAAAGAMGLHAQHFSRASSTRERPAGAREPRHARSGEVEGSRSAAAGFLRAFGRISATFRRMRRCGAAKDGKPARCSTPSRIMPRPCLTGGRSNR